MFLPSRASFHQLNEKIRTDVDHKLCLATREKFLNHLKLLYKKRQNYLNV